MTFAMLLPKRPVSGNKPPNRLFTEEVRAKAASVYGGKDLLRGRLYC
jgi:hypothetical protein